MLTAPDTTFPQHWTSGGHEAACEAYVVAAAAQAQVDRRGKTKASLLSKSDCMICLDRPLDPCTLPCGHAFCRGCVDGLRDQGVNLACPLCRSKLTPDREVMFELGNRIGEAHAVTHTLLHHSLRRNQPTPASTAHEVKVKHSPPPPVFGASWGEAMADKTRAFMSMPAADCSRWRRAVVLLDEAFDQGEFRGGETLCTA